MTVYGPYNDWTPSGSVENHPAATKPYKWFVHPFGGIALPYMIKYPESYDPNKSYGVLVYHNGGTIGYGALTGDTCNILTSMTDISIGNWCANGSKQVNTQVNDSRYQNFMDDYIGIYVLGNNPKEWQYGIYDNTKTYRRTNPNAIVWSGHSSLYTLGIKDLIQNIANGTAVPYTTYNDESKECGNPISYEYPNVNLNNIIFAGYSMGGYYTASSIALMRDFAAGFFICVGDLLAKSQDVSTNVYNENGPSYNDWLDIWLKKFIRSWAGVNVYWQAGTNDTAIRDFGVKKISQLVAEICEEENIQNRFIYESVLNGTHDGIYGAGTFRTTKKINPNIHTAQQQVEGGEGVTPGDLFRSWTPSTDKCVLEGWEDGSDISILDTFQATISSVNDLYSLLKYSTKYEIIDTHKAYEFAVVTNNGTSNPERTNRYVYQKGVCYNPKSGSVLFNLSNKFQQIDGCLVRSHYNNTIQTKRNEQFLLNL